MILQKDSAEQSADRSLGRAPTNLHCHAQSLTACQVDVRRGKEWARERSLQLVNEHLSPFLNDVSRRLVHCQPHFESPQDRQVLHPSIMTTAAVLHLVHSCAPSG